MRIMWFSFYLYDKALSFDLATVFKFLKPGVKETKSAHFRSFSMGSVIPAEKPTEILEQKPVLQ